MKKIFLFSLLLNLLLQGYSQRSARTTISLDEARDIFAKDQDAIDELTSNIGYVKDAGNKLDKFVGTWKGIYNNQTYELRLYKKVAFRFNESDLDEVKWDRMIGWITIKDNATGLIVYSNTSKPEKGNGLFGTYFLKGDLYVMSFVGRCYNEAGNLFISTLKSNKNKLRMSFSVNPDLQTKECPGNIKPILPISPQYMLLDKQ